MADYGQICASPSIGPRRRIARRCDDEPLHRKHCKSPRRLTPRSAPERALQTKLPQSRAIFTLVGAELRAAAGDEFNPRVTPPAAALGKSLTALLPVALSMDPGNEGIEVHCAAPRQCLTTSCGST